mmetsp:Transcript_2780/g.11924  ORF Transcript_2780/g.11924 Transcript_2780/m.11924 type:complete len:220 (-) Transcript_2780:731-1390(-)
MGGADGDGGYPRRRRGSRRRDAQTGKRRRRVRDPRERRRRRRRRRRSGSDRGDQRGHLAGGRGDDRLEGGRPDEPRRRRSVRKVLRRAFRARARGPAREKIVVGGSRQVVRAQDSARLVGGRGRAGKDTGYGGTRRAGRPGRGRPGGFPAPRAAAPGADNRRRRRRPLGRGQGDGRAPGKPRRAARALEGRERVRRRVGGSRAVGVPPAARAPRKAARV